MAINIISSGDLDYGKIKRYLCDTLEDFAELPTKVKEGSTVLVLDTGENYRIDANGNWNLIGSIGSGSSGEGGIGPAGPQGPEGPAGKDGYTPIKGTDYWTEEDKTEIIEELIESKPIKPYYDEELNSLFCNGVGIIIEEGDSNNNIITYYLDVNSIEKMNIPTIAKIYGGGNGLENPCNFSATSIVMNSGNVQSLCGGGLGGCHVGVASIVINGGHIKEGVSGGGANNKITDDETGNIVGQVLMTINNVDTTTIYGGGGTGMCRVGDIQMEVNGGKSAYLVAAGSNGYCGSAKMIINGGEFNVVQPTGNGSIGSATITLEDGTINKMYAGGPANTICGRTVLNIYGGSIAKLGLGSSNDGTAKHVSGEYVKNVIANEEITSELNLKLTYTLEETIKKMLNIEESVVISNIGEV